MRNFTYNTPTTLIFGDGVLKNLKEVVAQYGKNILLTYGGGSIKKIGLYDEIYKLLDGFNIYELSGIEPNPKYYQSVVPGVKICKEKKIDLILAVGGGSVLDCSKAISIGALSDKETWDLLTYKEKVTKALPIVTVLTLAATGSEYDASAVISRPETNDKIGFGDSHVFPKASFLDPKYTYSVSKKQTAAGTADAINHILEQFFVKESCLLNDGMMVSAIKSLMHNAKIALKDPDNYQARAELMYDASLACNGIFSNGSGPQNWPMHGIEHALSGYYDITHGEGLAIITPRWMRYVLSDRTLPRFLVLGKDLFNLKIENDYEMADRVIEEFYKFFESIGIPMHLKDVGIDDSRIKEMAHHIHINEHLDNENAFYPLDENDIERILINSL